MSVSTEDLQPSSAEKGGDANLSVPAPDKALAAPEKAPDAPESDAAWHIAILKRTAIFFLIMCFCATLLYLAGNLAMFLEETQFFLLETIGLFGCLQASAFLLCILLHAERAARKKARLSAMALTSYGLLCLCGGLLTFVTGTILNLARGA